MLYIHGDCFFVKILKELQLIILTVFVIIAYTQKIHSPFQHSNGSIMDYLITFFLKQETKGFFIL